MRFLTGSSHLSFTIYNETTFSIQRKYTSNTSTMLQCRPPQQWTKGIRDSARNLATYLRPTANCPPFLVPSTTLATGLSEVNIEGRGPPLTWNSFASPLNRNAKTWWQHRSLVDSNKMPTHLLVFFLRLTVLPNFCVLSFCITILLNMD